jgi:hypothetical protein
MNAAETYVDIYTSKVTVQDSDEGDYRAVSERHTSWVSESGQIEFFITASSNSFDKAPRRQV